jgi:hypothetical protein
MATEIENFRISEIKPPTAGWTFPSAVFADFTINTTGMRENIKEEWKKLRPRDILFLVGFKQNLDTVDLVSSSCQYLKSCVSIIRGCEILQVFDESRLPILFKVNYLHFS